MRTGAHEAHACRQGRRIVKSGSQESATESTQPDYRLRLLASPALHPNSNRWQSQIPIYLRQPSRAFANRCPGVAGSGVPHMGTPYLMLSGQTTHILTSRHRNRTER